MSTRFEPIATSAAPSRFRRVTESSSAAPPSPRREPPLTPPADLRPRTLEVLRLVGLVGPAPFATLRRLAPVVFPPFAELKSVHRLLYRELERLEVVGHVLNRRLPLATAGVFHPTTKGADLLRALGLAEVPSDALARYVALPRHEAALRDLRAELLLARFGDPTGPIVGLGWNDRARYEVVVSGKAEAYEPDGVYRLVLRDGVTWTIFVELDRGTEPLGRWTEAMKKASAPLAAAGPRALLLVLALTEKRLQSLLEGSGKALPAALHDRVRGAVAPRVTAATLWSRRFTTLAEWEAPLVDP